MKQDSLTLKEFYFSVKEFYFIHVTTALAKSLNKVRTDFRNPCASSLVMILRKEQRRALIINLYPNNYGCPFYKRFYLFVYSLTYLFTRQWIGLSRV